MIGAVGCAVGHQVRNAPHDVLRKAEPPHLVIDHAWVHPALGQLRTHLDRWIVETDDQGRFPESDAALRAALKRWGKKAVNPEYERVR